MLTLHETVWVETKGKPKTKYQIRGLGGLEYLNYQALLNVEPPEDGGKVRLAKGAAVIEPAAMDQMLSCGVLDWGAEVVEADGTPAKFSKDRIAEIPYTHMLELWSKISAMSVATPDTEKNSSSQSKSLPSQGNSIAGPADGEGIATVETPLQTPSTS